MGGKESRDLLLELFRLGSLLAELDCTDQDAEKVAKELRAALRSLQRATHVVERRQRPSHTGQGRHVLSNRERAIAEALADGRSHKEIAESFGLTLASAQSRVRAIYLKLGIHSKRELRALFSPDGRGA